MKKSWRAFLKISVKVLIVLVILAVVAVYAGVNDALHPPRRIPQGKTLRKYSIPHQSVDLITADPDSVKSLEDYLKIIFVDVVEIDVVRKIVRFRQFLFNVVCHMPLGSS